MRVFPDTNVLVIAFITRGICADIFRLILAEHELILSEVVIKELRSVLLDKINLPLQQVKSIVDFLKSFEVIYDSEPRIKIKIRDENDIYILASAINGKADIVITGDKDLLDVSETFGIKIVNPRGFLELVRKSSET